MFLSAQYYEKIDNYKMNNKNLISKLSEVISILSKLISELTKDSNNLTPIIDENIAQLPKKQSKTNRYTRLADLVNNTILPNIIIVNNSRIGTSDLITEIMKYPKYEPEKNEKAIHRRRSNLGQLLYHIKRNDLLSTKYKVVREKENYYCKNEEYKET